MKRKHLTVDVWSDIVCPWCAIGKRRLEAALAAFPHHDDVEVVWRAFELDPSAPAVQVGDNVSRLATKYGRSKAEAHAMLRRVTETAAADGLDFRLEQARSGNTFDAHRLLHWAAEHGLQGALKERFFRAYFTEEQAIGERDVLVRLASDVGLDAEQARVVLASDRFATDVREDEGTARKLGISGVPFFVLGGSLGVSGAQPAEVLVRALTQAWDNALEVPGDDDSSGAACGVDGCSPSPS
jgi:predicted DsbA family dithiol-disulfide isomerase